MGHYKPLRRLATRSGTTPPEFLRTCSQIGLLVNNWSGRNDLVVYGGEDSAEGQAVAAFYHDSAEIEVNVVKAFGEFADSESIGNLAQRAVQYEYPNVIGVVYHEALHARYTNWDRETLMANLDPSESKAFMLLEEVRIEARGVIDQPDNKLFLRESALAFALEGVDEAALADVSEVWQAGMLGILAVGRFDVGVLELKDISIIHARLVSILGQELFDSLRKIWCEFSGLKVTQIETGMSLARKWVELLREADPEGEGGFGEMGEGESGEGESMAIPSELSELIQDIAEQVQANNARSLSDQETTENWQEEAKSRANQSKLNNQKRETARRIFDKSNDSKGSGSSSTLSSTRPATPAERAAAVTIASMLEKAKYRERSLHEVRSILPQGKLKARAAVQNAALAARGSMERVPAWERKVRKHTDDPTLRLGVMVDISGSMGSAMEAMATTAWVMGEAGRRIQAKTAMVYYGSGVFPTLRVGQRLDQVRVFSAPDQTEEFGEAWKALDGELGLTFGDGVRMLVIVSDGQYRDTQMEAARIALQECKRNGVAVLWITPKNCWGHGAARIIENSAWGVHLQDLDTAQIALLVGKAAAEALGKVGGRV
jgi:hypothetical protein